MLLLQLRGSSMYVASRTCRNGCVFDLRVPLSSLRRLRTRPKGIRSLTRVQIKDGMALLMMPRGPGHRARQSPTLLSCASHQQCSPFSFPPRHWATHSSSEQHSRGQHLVASPLLSFPSAFWFQSRSASDIQPATLPPCRSGPSGDATLRTLGDRGARDEARFPSSPSPSSSLPIDSGLS
jgi:hypothetical protein